MNFSTLQGLTIPEGVVTQIADASGRVLWKLETSKPVVLKVAKQTLTTYAGETSYENEQFILLDIYPKTNGTVKVTYGGLTKTITDTTGATEPNAQQVFFGTFNGVSDSVTTPASGELTIEGAYSNFAVGTYQNNTKTISIGYCSCITGVVEWGDITSIADYAFYECTNIALTALPDGITSIGNYAFYKCTNIALTALPDGITSIGNYAFYKCTNIALTALPYGVTSIGEYAFGFGAAPGHGYDNDYYAAYIRMWHGTLTLPETVAEIGDHAFSSDSYYTGDQDMYYGYLLNLVLLSKSPPVIGDDPVGISGFGYQNGDAYATTITIPKGCMDAYKAEESWVNVGYSFGRKEGYWAVEIVEAS